MINSLYISITCHNLGVYAQRIINVSFVLPLDMWKQWFWKINFSLLEDILRHGASFSDRLIIELVQRQAVEQLGNSLFKGDIKVRGKMSVTSCSLAVSPVKADLLFLRLSIFFLSIFAKITIPNTLKRRHILKMVSF